MEIQHVAPLPASGSGATKPSEVTVGGLRIVRFLQYRDKSTGRYVRRDVVETMPPQQVLVESRTIRLPAESADVEPAAA